MCVCVCVWFYKAAGPAGATLVVYRLDGSSNNNNNNNFDTYHISWYHNIIHRTITHVAV